MDKSDHGHAVWMPWYGTPEHHCFGCAGHNPAGLGLQMSACEETLFCDFTLTRLHESYPGLVHGGVAAAILDELMGNLLVYRERKVCFTTRMRLTYADALRIGSTYRAVAWLHEQPAEPAGVYRVASEIRNAEGTPFVMAHATFQWITKEGWRRALGFENKPPMSLRPLIRDFDSDSDSDI